MNKFKVLLDSTADLNKVLRDRYEIEYLEMTFTINDKEYDANLDWENINPHDYYDLMRKGKRAITSLIKPNQLELSFKNYLDNKQDILYICCSSKLSGSFNYAKIVAQEISDLYPKQKIICFDSLRSNASQGLMGIDAAKMALEGKNIDEALDYLIENRLKYQTYAVINNLSWIHKAGRIKQMDETNSSSKDFFLIYSDSNGENTIIKKTLEKKILINCLAEMINSKIEKKTESTIFIEHADCLLDAIYLKEQILKLFIPKNIYINDLGPIIGATIGPDSLTVSFYGKKVSIK